MADDKDDEPQSALERLGYAPGQGRRTAPGDPITGRTVSRIDQDRENSEHLRSSLESAFEQHRETVPPSTPSPPVPKQEPSGAGHSGVDGAVLAVSELLFLLFGLPFGDALYHDKPLTPRHWLFISIAILCAIGGPMWPTIRNRYASPRVATSVAGAARDARVWIAVLLAFFLYGVAPEIYQRATAPIAPTAKPETGFTQQEVDAKISTALANINSQLAQATQQRDAAQLALTKANKPLPPVAPPGLADGHGLVSWDENTSSCRTNYTQVCGLLIGGKNNSSANIKFTSAQAISVNGDVVNLKLDLGAEGRIPATEAKIPPGASFQLWIEFSPSIEAPELVTKWGRGHFNAEYQGVKFSMTFNEDRMREMLGARTFEPRPTRDKSGN